MRILSIDAWRYGDGWQWNAWYSAGSIDRETFEAMEGNARKTLAWFRSEGYLKPTSGGKCAVDDDGYNVVIVDRGTREPLYAIEYGQEHN